MEDYLHTLQKELKGFPPEEQAALMEEVASHIESGESDPHMGKDPAHRRSKLMQEMGLPEDMGQRFKAVYRPNRFVDYLLVAIPYGLDILLDYLHIRPQYPWWDIRVDILFHLPLVAVGLWRRSAPLTLFWITVILMQLLYIVTQGLFQYYWYFGMQTVLWALLLVALLILYGHQVWKNRHDLLVVAFALLPLSMLALGLALWTLRPVTYAPYNPVDGSLLAIYLELRGRGLIVYDTFFIMALFFLATNRNIRWVALAVSALMIGLGREYLLDREMSGAVIYLAHWVYYLYILFPLAMIFGAWGLDWKRRHPQALVAA